MAVFFLCVGWRPGGPLVHSTYLVFRTTRIVVVYFILFAGLHISPTVVISRGQGIEWHTKCHA